MMRRGKFFITLGGVTVLVAGVFIGAFLVLKSSVTKGQFFSVSNQESNLSSSATQTLLEDLAKIKINSEQKKTGVNITQEFLDTIAQAGSGAGLAPEDYTSDEFFRTVVLPYLQSQQENVIANIPEAAVNVQNFADKKIYLENSGRHLLILAGAWQELFTLEPTMITGEETRERFTALTQLLAENDQELRRLNVPPVYAEFHRRLLQLSSALQTVIVSAVLREDNDPIRGLLAIASLPDIQQLGYTLAQELSYLETNLAP